MYKLIHQASTIESNKLNTINLPLQVPQLYWSYYVYLINQRLCFVIKRSSIFAAL